MVEHADEGVPLFEPDRLIAALQQADVRFVVIGGFAAVIHGSPYVTTDLDVVPDATRDNLGRLSAALDALHARVWSTETPEGLPFSHDAESLARAQVWNLVTDHGRLDITMQPDGTAGYPDLVRDAVHLAVLGTEADFASLADVIRSKEAANREKDRLVLPVLRRLLRESPPEEGRLSHAIVDADGDGATIVEVLDGIDGALARAKTGLRQAELGETVSLDDL